MTNAPRPAWPVREDSALLIVDMQERLLKAMPDKPRAQMLSNAGVLLTAADRLGLPVLVSEQYPQGLGPTVPEVREKAGAWNPVEKMVFSCAGEEAFRKRLEGLGRHTFLVAGVESHVCVLQTALDLVAAGNRVFVVQDATCSRTKENYRAGCALMASAGVSLTTTEIVLFQLLREAGTPEFKELSKLIR